MALRYASKNIAVPAATSFPHGLGVTPDEFWMNQRGVPTASASNVASFSTLAVDTTNVYILSGTTQTIDVFAVANHSIIK